MSRDDTSISDVILPVVSAVSMLAALWMIFLVAPTEKVQGVVQRIFYFHVSSAWTAFLAFFFVSLSSALYLRGGDPRWDRFARASGEIGLVFCTLVLVTGPIWARPIWGVWWTWDPRLTMTVILWTIYAAYLLLRAFGGEGNQVARFAAVLGIVGAVAIPLIMISVRLWRGIHPAVLQSRGGGGLDPTMRTTLYVTAVAFLLFFAWIVRVRVRLLRVEDELEELHRAAQPA